MGLLDQQRTNFAVVCIAEHLSINESLRLLADLKLHGICVTHVFVNQLVKDALDVKEMKTLDKIVERANPTDDEKQMIHRMKMSVQLCHSRKGIQETYLKKLKEADEVTSNNLTIVEIPLLPSEVTGSSALLDFSQLFMSKGYRSKKQPSELEEWKPSPFIVNLPTTTSTSTTTTTTTTTTEEAVEVELNNKDTVRIEGLKSAAQYNGLEGEVLEFVSSKGRYAIMVTHNDEPKKLLLKRNNLIKIEASTPKKKDGPESSSGPENTSGSAASDMMSRILQDPEVKEKLKIPKFQKAWNECQQNPMMAMQYLADPEIGPFITKMM